MTNFQEDSSRPACCWYVAVVRDGEPTGTQLKDMRRAGWKGGPVRPGWGQLQKPKLKPASAWDT